MKLLKIMLLITLLLQTGLFYLYIDLKKTHEELEARTLKLYWNNVELLRAVNNIDHLMSDSDLESIDDF